MVKKKYKIYLFRHGKTNYNVARRFTGWHDSKLTFSGILDAKKIAKKLKNEKFEVAICTKLSRSKDTLKYVLKYHPECKKIIEDNRMIERSYGILEGIKHKSFIKEIGKEQYDLMSFGDSVFEIEEKKGKKIIQEFLGEKEYEAIHRGYNVKVPGGESFYDVEQRVKSFIGWLKDFIRENKVNVAISAHGNSIRLFRKIMEKESVEEMASWVIPYDRVFEYEI